jgi:hypothetical protein
MKTSYILLALIVLITLMGMSATNVLLKQEYDKLDWSNPLQGFEERALPAARHWVLDGPINEIVIESGSQTQAFVNPNRLNYQLKQRGDTMFVTYGIAEKNAAELHMYAKNSYRDQEENIQLLIRTPDLKSVRMNNGSLTIRKFTLDSLSLFLMNSRLRTNGLAVTRNCAIDIRQCSKVILGADQYNSLQALVRDSSAIQLGNTQINKLAVTPSSDANVELTGQALQWLGKP